MPEATTLTPDSGIVFRAIADPTRREILELLREDGPLRAGDIAARFPDVTRMAVSKHLRLLREADLVQVVESDDARERPYSLNAAGFETVRGWLRRYDAFWQERLGALRRLAESDSAE
jgi:DNA-binding transcriptional ArsR family regulator